MSFEETLELVRGKVAQRVQQKIRKDEGAHPRLISGMLYAVREGGKYIRSFILYNFAHLYASHSLKEEGLKTWQEKVFDSCAALELIHAYSLVHDDLPAMDNASLRRGKPSCWITFDEATAILVGDSLLTLSFETLTTLPGVPDEIKVEILRLFARASGHQGMIAGQMMDLFPLAITRQAIDKMMGLKTGALFGLACEVGVVLSQGRTECREKARSYGFLLGNLFQLMDDLHDVLSDKHQSDKPVQHDQDKVNLLKLVPLTVLMEEVSQGLSYLSTLTEAFPDKGGQLKYFHAYFSKRLDDFWHQYKHSGIEERV